MATIDDPALANLGPFYCLWCGNEAQRGSYWWGSVQAAGFGPYRRSRVAPAHVAVCLACLAKGFLGILIGDAFTADELPPALGETIRQAYRIRSPAPQASSPKQSQSVHASAAQLRSLSRVLGAEDYWIQLVKLV